MNENILVPILIALGPGFSALLFVSRLRINYWLNAILGGSGWLIALMIRFPLLALINSLSVFQEYLWHHLLLEYLKKL